MKSLAVDGPKRGSLLEFDDYRQTLVIPIAREIKVGLLSGKEFPAKGIGFDSVTYRNYMISFGPKTIAIATIYSDPGMDDVFDLMVTEKAKAAIYVPAA